MINTNTRIIIIGNGKIDDYKIFKRIIKKGDLIICVDGGTEHLRKTLFRPHYIIGDLDSLRNILYDKTCQILKFPSNKDKTDTELAIDFALMKKPKEIVLLGMTSQSRFDHTLNNIFLMERLAQNGIETTLIVNSFTQIKIITDSVKLLQKDGRLVSLIPLSYNVQHITTKGFKYPLNNETLIRYRTRGISNIINNTNALIKLKKGLLLVIQTKNNK